MTAQERGREKRGQSGVPKNPAGEEIRTGHNAISFSSSKKPVRQVEQVFILQVRKLA